MPIVHDGARTTQSPDAPGAPIAGAQELQLRRAHSRQRATCARLDYLARGSPTPNPLIMRRMLRTLLADATAVQLALCALSDTLAGVPIEEGPTHGR